MDAAWIDYIMLPCHLDETAEQAELPLDIHPNPTTDQITLDLVRDGDFIVQVFDNEGRLIMTKHNQAVLSFKDLQAGLYHIVVEQNGRHWSQKIIKM